MKYIGWILLLTVLAFAGCKKNRFKRSKFLVEFYDNMILPDLLALESGIADLKTAADAYASAGSVASLQSLQAKFTSTLTSFEKVVFYNLGDISAISVYNAAYKTTVDTAAIWTKYAASSSFTADIVASYNNTSKGIFAIEYLLFSNHATDSLSVPKFLSFLTAQVDLLGENFGKIKTSWLTYKKNFTEHDDEGVDGSYNVVVNRVIHVLEDIIDKRINKPLDAADPSLAVGHWSETAWNNIKTQVLQLNNVYMGNAETPFNSIYNSVHKKNKKLADDLKEKFETVVSVGEGMSLGFDYYLSNGSAELTAYKEKLKEILVLFKLDVIQELDIVLTFGDNDGD